MTTTVRPALARTDVPAPRKAHSAVAPPAGGPPPTPPAPPPSYGSVRTVGVALAVSSAAWAWSMFVLAPDGVMTLAGAVTSVAFQAGLIAMLATMWRSRATGTGRAGRILLGIAVGLVAVATVQSVSTIVPGAGTVAVVLDPFWPLSMLGMMITGITVACVGRWRGAARVWTPVATSWIALLPLLAVVPQSVLGAVATAHIVAGYVVLGVILALRPDLTRR